MAACSVLLFGCTQAPVQPPPPAAAPAPRIVPFPFEDPVLVRTDRYMVVTARGGDTPAVLAERWLRSSDAAPRIAALNGTSEFRTGQAVAIPLSAEPVIDIDASGLQAVTILCYHRFGPRPSPLTVTPAAFEAQMAHLAKAGYNVVPLDRLPDFLAGRARLPEKAVVITIDDGYRSTFEVAFPVLKRLGFHATVFLYSDFVGVPDALTWAQMREMKASGLIDIQAHSKSHANLTLRQRDETEARYRERTRREIDGPLEVIRAQLKEANLAFAYPYGDVNEFVAGELSARNVRLGLTVTPGPNAFFAPPYMLRRSMVFGSDDMEAFRGKLLTHIPVARP